jgi:geranylgeranyl diphosphate synthase type II
MSNALRPVAADGSPIPAVTQLESPMAITGVLPRDRASGDDPDPRALFDRVETRLRDLTPSPHRQETDMLFRAADAALLSSGKRVRPLLCMLACDYVGGDPSAALDYGCAVELVHAASLVLDDLPCMDDATLRRGQPALHVAYGEDTAVLTSIALLNQAHRTILLADIDAEQKITLLDELTTAVGFDGLAHGQLRDLRDGPEHRTEDGLRRLNALKTGALLVAALRGGGMIGGADARQIEALTRFGDCIGFAFQLCDDLNDVLCTAQVLGKDVAQDRNKRTFIDLWDIGGVQAAIRQAVDQAEQALGQRCALSDYTRGLLLHADVQG